MMIFQLSYLSMYANTFSFTFKSPEVIISIYKALRPRLSSKIAFFARLKVPGGVNMNIKHKNENLRPGMDSWT